MEDDRNKEDKRLQRVQSSKNTHPWHFIAITDKAIFKALSECGE